MWLGFFAEVLIILLALCVLVPLEVCLLFIFYWVRVNKKRGNWLKYWAIVIGTSLAFYCFGFLFFTSTKNPSTDDPYGYTMAMIVTLLGPIVGMSLGFLTLFESAESSDGDTETAELIDDDTETAMGEGGERTGGDLFCLGPITFVFACFAGFYVFGPFIAISIGIAIGIFFIVRTLLRVLKKS